MRSKTLENLKIHQNAIQNQVQSITRVEYPYTAQRKQLQAFRRMCTNVYSGAYYLFYVPKQDAS